MQPKSTEWGARGLGGVGDGFTQDAPKQVRLKAQAGRRTQYTSEGIRYQLATNSPTSFDRDLAQRDGRHRCWTPWRKY